MITVKHENGFPIRTICEICQNAVPNGKDRGCEWSMYFRPVPNWTARFSPIAMDKRMVESYAVEDCPRFIQDPPRDPLPCDQYIH